MSAAAGRTKVPLPGALPARDTRRIGRPGLAQTSASIPEIDSTTLTVVKSPTKKCARLQTIVDNATGTQDSPYIHKRMRNQG